MNANGIDYGKILRDEESLKLFLATVADFDRTFCDRMAAGDDFTLRIEVRGDRGELIHARMHAEQFKRPHGVEKRIEGKKRRVNPGLKPYLPE